MTYLKFYRNEREKFPSQDKTRIPDKNVSKFAQKIARHFKVSLFHITLRCYNGSGSASRVYDTIRLSHNPTVLLIIHEIGHLYTRQKLREQKHNKNLMLFIKRACRYAEKMEYWSLEASETESLERKKPKQFLVYSKCPICDFVNDWQLTSLLHRKWYKNHYAIGTVHDMTCVQCKIRTRHTITEQKLITFEDRLAEQLERRRNFSNYALAIPKTEKALAIPETKALMVYKIPLGCA